MSHLRVTRLSESIETSFLHIGHSPLSFGGVMLHTDTTHPKQKL